MLIQQQTATVVGAGPAGFALAAGLQSQGTSVLVYAHPAHQRHASRVRREGVLRASGLAQEGPAAVPVRVRVRVTTDMAEAVAFSRVLFLTVPSTGQETVLEELRRFSLRRHAVVAVPGNLFSLVAAAAGLDAGCVLETNLSPYSCRMGDDGELRVLGKKELVFIAAAPDRRGGGEDEEDEEGQGDGIRRALCEEVARMLAPMRLRWCSSVVEVSLANVNGVFHPLMMLMNIGAALGLRLDGAVGVSNACYGQAFAGFVDLARGSPPHNRLRAPASLEHRNLSEDVPDLLVAWCGLAEKLGVDAAPIRAVVALAQMATGVDYLATGRNLRRLGLDRLTRAELIARFGAATTEKKKPSVDSPVTSSSTGNTGSHNTAIEACRLELEQNGSAISVA
ncbi:hypothetical protein VTH06DRAFT_2362 [Thermothelomyces fergusii]